MMCLVVFSLFQLLSSAATEVNAVAISKTSTVYCMYDVHICVSLSLSHPSCQSSPSCNWCSDENKCVPLGVCCDSTSRCCSQEPVTSLPECFQESCPIGTCTYYPIIQLSLHFFSDQDICPVSSSVVTPTPTSTTRPINNTQAAIIGGVLGGLLALALVAILVVLCVWYQFFRAPDSIDDKAKGTYMFDDVRVASSNKTAIELKENEANGIGNGN